MIYVFYFRHTSSGSKPVPAKRTNVPTDVVIDPGTDESLLKHKEKERYVYVMDTLLLLQHIEKVRYVLVILAVTEHTHTRTHARTHIQIYNSNKNTARSSL